MRIIFFHHPKHWIWTYKRQNALLFNLSWIKAFYYASFKVSPSCLFVAWCWGSRNCWWSFRFWLPHDCQCQWSDFQRGLVLSCKLLIYAHKTHKWNITELLDVGMHMLGPTKDTCASNVKPMAPFGFSGIQLPFTQFTCNFVTYNWPWQRTKQLYN